MDGRPGAATAVVILPVGGRASSRQARTNGSPELDVKRPGAKVGTSRASVSIASKIRERTSTSMAPAPWSSCRPSAPRDRSPAAGGTAQRVGRLATASGTTRSANLRVTQMPRGRLSASEIRPFTRPPGSETAPQTGVEPQVRASQRTFMELIAFSDLAYRPALSNERCPMNRTSPREPWAQTQDHE